MCIFHSWTKYVWEKSGDTIRHCKRCDKWQAWHKYLLPVYRGHSGWWHDISAPPEGIRLVNADDYYKARKEESMKAYWEKV